MANYMAQIQVLAYNSNNWLLVFQRNCLCANEGVVLRSVILSRVSHYTQENAHVYCKKKIFATQLKSADDANHNKFVLYYSFNTKLLAAYFKTVDPHTWKLEYYWQILNRSQFLSEEMLEFVKTRERK